MKFQLSKRSKKNREGIDSRLIEISDLAIQLTVIDFGHGNHAGLRIAKEQHQLFLDGLSKADGYDDIGEHQSGNALDFYAYVDGKASWQHHHLAMVAAAHLQAASILGYKIQWGGFWQRKNPKFKNGIPYGWDCAHIELA
ncbi:hypothetical protein KA005_44475 [bacterium]|nr:hypothetical protein [bacterium]